MRDRLSGYTPTVEGIRMIRCNGKHFWLSGMICLAIAAASTARATDASGDRPPIAPLQANLRQMIEQARDGVFPALVNISVVTMRYWDGKEHKGRATGSGTIISPEGYVVTNQHVTYNGKTFKCTLA